MPNRLAEELSPYLLQHAENPVDWYPWGEPAFGRARTEEKPIFLSVGYSTCHWCHVMERESFENDDIAALLNRDFVSVKVDREERPDIDRVYMTFVQITTSSGGWPMSVWLTPELKPFFGGTYFPPTSRHGRPGFTEVLVQMRELWANERKRLVESADTLMERLRHTQSDQRHGTVRDTRRIAGLETLATGIVEFERSFDENHGGFGGSPKFPRPGELIFLLREFARTGSVGSLKMAIETLRAMNSGGMHDHIGGGFHRYSVDAEWRIPHFEKMLYDQSQLVVAYLEAAQAGKEEEFLRVAEDTLRYVARDLTGTNGEFYSAEDADSVPYGGSGDSRVEKSEGAFYLWSSDEFERLLGSDVDIARRRYGVETHGNAPQDPTGEFRGMNHFYLARTESQIAKETGVTPKSVRAVLGEARETLLKARSRRPRPDLDDKVLAAWNGLMIGAAARAGHVLHGDAGVRALSMAERAASFVRSTLWDAPSKTLYRRYRAGQVSIEGYCEDYAFVVWGALELFQATGDPDWLSWACELQQRQDELFWDAGSGGWFSTTGRDSSVLFRVKDEYDGAEPSAGSMSVINQLILGHLGIDEAGVSRRIQLSLERFGHGPGNVARIVPMMAAGLSQYHAGTSQVVIVGPQEREDTQALHACMRRHFLPFAVRVPVEPGETQERLAALLPFIEAMVMINDRATAYVCGNFTCRAPVTEPSAFDEQLGAL